MYKKDIHLNLLRIVKNPQFTQKKAFERDEHEAL